MPRLLQALLLLSVLLVAACARGPQSLDGYSSFNPPLYPNETSELRKLINEAAMMHDLPPALLHRVIIRESRHQPGARNGPYWGLMQIQPQTASTMGFRGDPADLLNPAVNLRYAGAYLRGAYIVANGDPDRAVSWYANGFYYEARNRCLLVETGLRSSEVRRDCR
jgi:soluble lytic murein transglycosylase-like protein